MSIIKINTREEYEFILSKGYEPLHDDKFAIEHHLRRSIQTDTFGKGNKESNNIRFYKYCIDTMPMVCQECGKPIAHPSATNVSHILSRGAHPDMAYDPRNVNILCQKCHEEWENGNRCSMRIFSKNCERIDLLKEEYSRKRTDYAKI